MTRKTTPSTSAPADITPDAYYQVVLADRAVLPHETLPAREAPYEMRGRFLLTVLDKVESYAAKED